MRTEYAWATLRVRLQQEWNSVGNQLAGRVLSNQRLRSKHRTEGIGIGRNVLRRTNLAGRPSSVEIDDRAGEKVRLCSRKEPYYLADFVRPT